MWLVRLQFELVVAWGWAMVAGSLLHSLFFFSLSPLPPLFLFVCLFIFFSCFFLLLFFVCFLFVCCCFIEGSVSFLFLCVHVCVCVCVFCFNVAAVVKNSAHFLLHLSYDNKHTSPTFASSNNEETCATRTSNSITHPPPPPSLNTHLPHPTLANSTKERKIEQV